MAEAARLMTKAEVIAYCKVAAGTFDRWRREGIVPGPVPGTIRWDRRAIDAALDRLSGLSAQSPMSEADELMERLTGGPKAVPARQRPGRAA